MIVKFVRRREEMELFNLNNTTSLSEGFHLYIDHQKLDYWLQFTSFQTSWRGEAITSDAILDRIEKEQIQSEYVLFSNLHLRFLSYISPDGKREENHKVIHLSNHIIQAISKELDDFIGYCAIYEEKQLLEISREYKQLFFPFTLTD